MLYQLLTRLDRPRKNALLLGLDICLIGVAFLLAILVLFGPDAPAQIADPLVLAEAAFSWLAAASRFWPLACTGSS